MSERKQLIEELMAITNAMKNKMSRFAVSGKAGHQITHSQWFVICIIEANKDIGVTDISKMLGISSSAATQLVDGLVKNGYVQRKTSKTDKRFFNLFISKKGKKNIIAIKKQYNKVMESLFEALNNRELETYLELHKKILSNITK